MTYKAKYIGIKGIKDVESLIPVNNRYGIKATALFDSKIGLYL